MTGIFKSIFLLLVGSRSCISQRLDCRSNDLNACIRLADPLLQANHVFPSTSKDIDHVCNVLFPQTWSKFVDCIKQYTTSCLSQDQRGEFNRAVGDSINSVHKMCTNEDYKNDYLRHADCIKEKSTNPEYCGTYYSRLLGLVRGDAPIVSQTEICCAHSSYKECVIAETEACPCTGDKCRQGMEATGFARAMLDKALGFLLKQCQSYVPAERDCPIYKRKQDKEPRLDENNQNDGNRYDEGSYFPSGMAGRDERREDDWTNMNGNNNGGLEPDNSIMDRTEKTETQTYLAPSSWETTISPLVEPFIPQQQEDERRKPWFPSTDIRSFDDIFSNAVDNTQAQLLASGANQFYPSIIIILPLIILIILQ